ncbi:MAG: hypothetical protein LBQ88_04670 [Treponema sp.]|jgi:hypothetical protein|nr:hypothetical protein [Treponema sp.]
MKNSRRPLPAVISFFLVIGCATSGPSVETVPLDAAIQAAGRNIEADLEPGVKAAILNFNSPSDQFSEYVIEELSLFLVNGKKVVVVDRKELDLIRKEMDFQMSGEVSDESAQAIGKKLGAQSIISGALVSMGRTYRFRVKTINVESAAIESSSSADINAGDERAAFLLKGAKSAPPPESPQPAPRTESPQPAPQTDKIYKIGDYGPAGGIVFYDKGAVESGWRYLEAAPRDIGPAQWGAWGTGVGTGTEIGSGKKNTELIINKLRQLGETGRAAQLCASLDINGYRDWFLPSRDELNLMYTNLKKKGLGDLGGGFYYYWSSSEGYNDENAWLQSFSGYGRDDGHDGGQDDIHKGEAVSVRAVRAF